MGKRKGRAASDPSIPPFSTPSFPPPDAMPCSAGNPSSSKKSARDANSSLKKKLQSSSKDTPVMDNAVKQSNSQISLSLHHHHRQNQGRSAFLKRSRYHGAHPHFPRNHSPADYSANNSISHRNNKRSSFPDQYQNQNQKLSFKVGGRWNTEWRPSSEGIEKLMYQTERITASTSSAMTSSAVLDMVCVLCQDLLRHSPERHYQRSIGMIIHDDTCMVAVLVCGHVFHAKCLEKRTQVRDARDPPCPLCSGCTEKVQEA